MRERGGGVSQVSGVQVFGVRDCRCRKTGARLTFRLKPEEIQNLCIMAPKQGAIHTDALLVLRAGVHKREKMPEKISHSCTQSVLTWGCLLFNGFRGYYLLMQNFSSCKLSLRKRVINRCR